MSALIFEQGQGREAARAASSGRFDLANAFVLPRWLRRPVRHFARFGSGDASPPRFVVRGMSAGLLLASSLYGVHLGGHTPAVVEAITARTGFAIDEIRVSGHRETSEIDILEQLGLTGWTSLIGFDPAEARRRIADLPWVQVAAVRKVYPDTLEVKVEEREAYAIWQNGGQLTLVEKTGETISLFSGGARASLPLVVGDGAPQAAAAFLARMQEHPELAGRVKSYVRVAGRRWDLRLDNGVIVRLPEFGEDQAILDFARLCQETDLVARDILGVDMRIPGRLVVKLTPEATERREAALSAKPKAKKAKPGKRA